MFPLKNLMRKELRDWEIPTLNKKSTPSEFHWKTHYPPSAGRQSLCKLKDKTDKESSKLQCSSQTHWDLHKMLSF